METKNPFKVIDNAYTFECTMCGNCCTGDQKVFLNLYDLYKIARFKKYNNTRQLFLKQLVMLVKGQNDVWLPMIKFKRLISRKHHSPLPFKFCPFLINEINDENELKGYCSLHPDRKPLICSLAPVGRIVDIEKQSEKFVFAKPAPDCMGVKSQKINYLDEIKLKYKEDLENELRYYRILKNAADRRLNKSEIIETIYSFTVSQPFKKSLSHIEDLLNRI